MQGAEEFFVWQSHILEGVIYNGFTIHCFIFCCAYVLHYSKVLRAILRGPNQVCLYVCSQSFVLHNPFFAEIHMPCTI